MNIKAELKNGHRIYSKPCTEYIELHGDDVVMISDFTGKHSISYQNSDAERIEAHWKIFKERSQEHARGVVAPSEEL